jgi:Copper type II ascorbate-dependent monooxygenase, C-terminal domain
MGHFVRLETNRWIAVALLMGAIGCGSEANAPPGNNLPLGGTAGINLSPGLMGGAGGTVAHPTTAGASSMLPPNMNGGAMVGAAGTGVEMPPDAQGTVPCGVSKVTSSSCQGCHGATLAGGAPMQLVTFADWHRPAKTQPTMKVYQLAQLRIHNMANPMPPVSSKPLAAAELTTLDTWLQAGALTAPASEAVCAPGGTNVDGGHEPLVPGPGETCYEFKVHQSTTSVDATKYDIVSGEHYEQFYYKTPWPKDTVAIAYSTRMDNPQVLHHWLLFSTLENEVEGYHKTAPLPTLIGVNPVLLAGWAVGGPNLVAPTDVGFELPDPGAQINVQWHFYNSTPTTQADASSVQICTVPKAMRKNLGAITWAGTEDLNGNIWAGGPGMPAGQESTFTTTCIPGRAGLGANDSIHIIGFEPHMHRIGKNMKTAVVHMDGTMETLFDKPFKFGNETHYYQDYELKPGEQLVTSCTFMNDTAGGVAFGESSDSEMCYQFVFSWPAHALSNGAFSLLGVPDTCW